MISLDPWVCANLRADLLNEMAGNSEVAPIPWVGRCLVRLPERDGWYEDPTGESPGERFHERRRAEEWAGQIIDVKGRDVQVVKLVHLPWIHTVPVESVFLDARTWPVRELLKRAVWRELRLLAGQGDLRLVDEWTRHRELLAFKDGPTGTTVATPSNVALIARASEGLDASVAGEKAGLLFAAILRNLTPTEAKGEH